MGKFGSFRSSGIRSQISKVTKNVETQIGNVSPEKISGIMEKATIGNAASFLGGKVGLNVNAGKVDGVINRYNEMKSSVQEKIWSTVISSAEKAGFKISLPDASTLTNYLLANNIVENIENIGSESGLKGIEDAVKKIDLKNVANDLGLSITKIQVPESKESVDSTLKSTSENAISKLSDIGGVIGSGASGIKNEVESGLQDIKNTINE